MLKLSQWFCSPAPSGRRVQPSQGAKVEQAKAEQAQPENEHYAQLERQYAEEKRKLQRAGADEGAQPRKPPSPCPAHPSSLRNLEMGPPPQSIVLRAGHGFPGKLSGCLCRPTC